MTKTERRDYTMDELFGPMPKTVLKPEYRNPMRRALMDRFFLAKTNDQDFEDLNRLLESFGLEPYVRPED